MKVFRFAIALCALASVAACTTYYEVTDPTTGRVYYSTDIEDRKGGAVTLVDDRNGAEVTVQNSEIREISKDTYKDGLSKPIEVAPAPAPAPAEAAPAEAEAAPAEAATE